MPHSNTSTEDHGHEEYLDYCHDVSPHKTIEYFCSLVNIFYKTKPRTEFVHCTRFCCGGYSSLLSAATSSRKRDSHSASSSTSSGETSVSSGSDSLTEITVSFLPLWVTVQTPACSSARTSAIPPMCSFTLIQQGIPSS